MQNFKKEKNPSDFFFFLIRLSLTALYSTSSSCCVSIGRSKDRRFKPMRKNYEAKNEQNSADLTQVENKESIYLTVRWKKI